MKKVLFTFVGDNSDEIAQKFYTWVIDGGLADTITDNLSDTTINLDLLDFDNETFDIAFKSELKRKA
jgi:hypothetical protein